MVTPRPKKIRVYKARYSEPRDRPWRVSIHGMDEYFCTSWREALDCAEFNIKHQIGVIGHLVSFGDDPRSYVENGSPRIIGIIQKSEPRSYR